MSARLQTFSADTGAWPATFAVDWLQLTLAKTLALTPAWAAKSAAAAGEAAARPSAAKARAVRMRAPEQAVPRTPTR
jgi:hypothetical protein